MRELPPARYPEDDWQIVRACFTLLRRAAAELKVEFAEAGVVDFTEVSQMAQRVLKGEDELPSDAAIDIADGIHHLLVDEFQDTSRRQHKLISSLVAAWPEPEGRTVFVVGDPMQSIARWLASASVRYWFALRRASACSRRSALALHPILEMRIERMAVHGIRNARKRKVVRAHNADRVMLHQFAQHKLGADQAVVRIGAGQQFIQQKQHRHRALGQVGDHLDRRISA